MKWKTSPSAGAHVAAVGAPLVRAACSWRSTRTVRRIFEPAPYFSTNGLLLTPTTQVEADFVCLLPQTVHRRAAQSRSEPRSRRRKAVIAAEAQLARGHRLLCRISGRQSRHRRSSGRGHVQTHAVRPRQLTCRVTRRVRARSSAAARAARASGSALQVGFGLRVVPPMLPLDTK